MNEVDVVVVGAGPVGLYLAIDLAMRGVSVQLLDKARRPLRHSRASVLWPRQLELMQAIGVVDDLMDRGRAIEGVEFHSNRHDLGQLRFSAIREAPYPFGLAISQEMTERMLVKRYEGDFGPLARSSEVVGLSQDASGVDLTVVTVGRTENVRAKWVIGADGAHSAVRELAGITFTGPPGTARFGIGDAAIEGTLSTRMLHYIYSRSTAIGISPFTEKTMRIAVAMSPDAEKPDHAFFRKILTQNSRLVTDVHAPEWTSAFDVAFRTAERFRAGRVLLAGDAAHLLSPAGGQGMNTGLQDAANLGWKLAHVIQKIADERLLDTYDDERRAAAARVASTSARLARWSGVSGPRATKMRDAAVFVATRSLRRPNLVDTITQLDTRYDLDNEASGSKLIGSRFPSFAGKAPSRAPWSSWPTHDRDRHTLFLWPGRTLAHNWAVQVAAIEPRTAHCVRDLGAIAAPGSALRLGRRPHYYLVRPDGHIIAEGVLGRDGAIPPHVLNAQQATSRALFENKKGD
ncbi:FAD-dependent monooxygenase [Arthrobacter sp. Y-9]|uniref:FAD-dependent monooxygenase n=1 Tax=Arthrobacter sp. Y-9 TaxID=3039385 RepID=UPI00241D7521|nr:FAD-dependent monooxygenase [Arthrobacter sp. Y-9]WFR83472.1 FAD-dependent monooxygenase [Arthrobacter sp. Y-9]